jgi:predicted ATPase/signal transduction histidine kinase
MLRDQARAPGNEASSGQQRLDRWLHHRSLSTDGFLELAIQLAEDLDRLHARRVLHLHLHPGNVVMDPEGRPAFLDPGSEAASELGYIAPEQTGRMDRLPDQRADLYALGAIYYRALTGAPPFAGTDSIDVVHAHLARTPAAPAELNPQVPAVVSQIVLRLLAKMPEQRYQSAQTLLTELYQARAHLRPDGTIAPFELGRADLVAELPLPGKLYGRAGELDQLGASWSAVAAGSSRVVMLAGEGGSGKSRLARALEPLVVADGRGGFLVGKFSLRRSNVPHAALVEAVGGLMRRLLTEPEGLRAAWARGIREGLGRNAGVITPLVPDLARLIGEPPPVPALDPPGTQNRFQQAFLDLLRALLQRQPLVLFLDDLQWADAASLRLIQMLGSAPDLPRLLLLGAYRHEDVRPDHPLLAALSAMRSLGAQVSLLPLAPLDVASVTELCADALGAEPERTRPLAEVLVRKTAGNPFFLERLLRFLQKTGLLRLDGPGRWSWDLPALESVNVTDNVADLLIKALGHVPQPVRAVLGAAASIGRTIPRSWLAVACGQSPEEIIPALHSAVSEGYLVGSPENGLFHFAHDWLQQACSPLLLEADQKRLHHRLGLHLLPPETEEELADDLLFAGLDQLNLASGEIQAPTERLRVCQLNRRAARRARLSSAYDQALAHLQHAIALLPPERWQDHRALTFSLHRDALECALVCDQPAVAEALFRDAQQGGLAPHEAGELYRIRADAAMSGNAMAQAIEWARRGLQTLGIELPDAAAAGAAERQTAQDSLAGRNLDDILAGPVLDQPEQICAMQLLRGLMGPAYVTGSPLYPFVMGRMINISLAHGHSASSATAYAFHAMDLACQTGGGAAAHRFGQLAVDLARRFGDPGEELRSTAALLHNIAPWRTPLRAIVPLLQRAHRQGLETGELHHAIACGAGAAMLLFHQGAELHRVLQPLEAAAAASRHASALSTTTTLAIYRLQARCLQGLTRGRNRGPHAGPPAWGGNCFDDGALDEETFAGQLSPMQQATYHTLRLQTCFLFGDLPRARAFSHAARPLLARPRLAVLPTEHAFYTALTLAADHEHASPAQAASTRAAIAGEVERFRVWSEACPENFRHKHLLLGAELARIEGRTLDALRGYDEAIEAASREQFLQDEALAHELAARFHRAEGRKRFALLYLRAARDLYRRWGATAKVDVLEEEYPEYESDWLPAPSSGSHLGPEPAGAPETAFDLVALVRAAEAISQEVVLERLLDKLMEVCLTITGAERGALLLAEDEGLTLRARRSVTEPTSLHREPLTRTTQIPHLLVEQVQQSGEPLVLADASAHLTLGADPYVRARRVRSALALPILRQGRLVGVLYLENNLATRVFKPERSRLLQLLSSQIASALENSRLFERLSEEERALRFLAEASAALAESLDYQRTLRRVAELAVSGLADTCAVYTVEGEEVRRTASATADPAHQPRLDQVGRRLSETGSLAFVRQVVRSGAPIFLPRISQAELERHIPDPQARQMLEAIQVKSGMVLPLPARGRVLGVMALSRIQTDRRFNDSDLAVGTELARRAAAAIDNARLYQQKEEAVRLRNDFLSVASHELRTPIASLRLMTETIAPGHAAAVEPDPGAAAALTGPDLVRAVALIGRQSRRLQALVENLLDVEQIRTGALRVRLEPVDLVEVVHETLQHFKAEAARVACPITVTTSTPRLVGRWDRLRLEQVVANLLSNALKFGSGAPVDIAVEGREGVARLVVRDHGIGIPPERLPQLFRRFERAVPATNYGGLGLGLYIVRNIVEALRGQVAVESAPPQGTRFTVTLPLDQHDSLVIAAPAGVLPRPGPESGI